MSDNTAQIVYRQNEKLDTIRPTIEEKLQENEYDFDTKVFPAGTPEEKIREWAEDADLSSTDLILADRTFGRAAGNEIDNDSAYSLDKLYNEASEEAAKNARNSVRKRAKENQWEEATEDARNLFEEYVGVFQSFKEQPEKLYLAYPKITDHDYDMRKLAEKYGKENGHLDEDESLWDSEEKETDLKHVAGELASAFEEAGYNTEVVGEFLTFDDMEENSWFLVDGHFADNYNARTSEREGSKIRLMFDSLEYGAMGLGLWEVEDAVDEPDQLRKKEFEEAIDSGVEVTLEYSIVKNPKEKYLLEQ